MEDPFIPIGAHEFNQRLRKFGGWPRVLDPAYSPTEELYELFRVAGYDRQHLDRQRQKEGRPERDAWIESLAERLYLTWRYSVSNLRFIPTDWAGIPGITPGVRWHQYPTFHEWDDELSTMKRLSISIEDIETFIDSNSERFPQLKLGGSPWN